MVEVMVVKVEEYKYKCAFTLYAEKSKTSDQDCK